MAGRHFTLTKYLSDFVDEQVSTGTHRNASEVVCEALRRYQEDIEDERADLAVLEKVATRGLAEIARGNFITVNGPEDARKLMQQFNTRAAERAAKSRPAKKAKRG